MTDCFEKKIILITGPSRSGKSEWAEQLTKKLALQHQQSVIYLATAMENSDDPEWQQRIEIHRKRRPADWQTLQEAIAVSEAIESLKNPVCLLVDSLGTWVANLLEKEEEAWLKEIKLLSHALETSCANIVLVAEETGWGVVPAYPMGRQFRDRLGYLTRHVGAIADEVYLVTGGYALNLSQLGERLEPAIFPPNLSVFE